MYAIHTTTLDEVERLFSIDPQSHSQEKNTIIMQSSVDQ